MSAMITSVMRLARRSRILAIVFAVVAAIALTTPCWMSSDRSTSSELTKLEPVYLTEQKEITLMQKERNLSTEQSFRDGHRLAVLVPFRDRFDELLEFAPHMKKFLTSQGVHHGLFVLNQVDSHRFNRASLLNTGFVITEKLGYDYFALHDVDLLPLNPNLRYDYPQNGPFHIAAPWLHPKYGYPTFVGGILLMTREQLQVVNGLTNLFWGWGGEDDDLYKRIRRFGLVIRRPPRHGFGTNKKTTFRHVHGQTRERDMRRFFNQTEVAYRFDTVTGLSDLRYNLESTKYITVEGADVTILNIALHCNNQLTPYCDVPTDPPPKK